MVHAWTKNPELQGIRQRAGDGVFFEEKMVPCIERLEVVLKFTSVSLRPKARTPSGRRA
jgi:hypothetical protein